jgi:NADP-dependent 3-hydroxy acid dehydrogenase YdfG
MDLMSFDSIKKAARKVSEECSRLDILVLNAG